MLPYKARVTDQVLNLITSLRTLRFGEVYGVEVDNVGKTVQVNVSRAERDLIQLIDDGTQYIDVLTVHQGEPVMAEIDFKNEVGFRCRKKVKFPTE